MIVEALYNIYDAIADHFLGITSSSKYEIEHGSATPQGRPIRRNF